MRDSRRVMLLLAVVLSWGTAAPAQTTPRQTTPRSTSKPATSKPATSPPTTTSRRAVEAGSSSDPFVGVWKLNAGKSTYESGGAPKGFTRTYEDRGGGTIFMTTEVSVQGTTARAYLVYKRDGKPYPEAAVGAEAIRMETVRSINPRTEEVSFDDGKTSQMSGTITVSADGKTMTQVLNGKNAKGPFTNTLVFDRQR